MGSIERYVIARHKDVTCTIPALKTRCCASRLSEAAVFSRRDICTHHRAGANECIRSNCDHKRAHSCKSIPNDCKRFTSFNPAHCTRARSTERIDDRVDWQRGSVRRGTRRRSRVTLKSRGDFCLTHCARVELERADDTIRNRRRGTRCFAHKALCSSRKGGEVASS